MIKSCKTCYYGGSDSQYVICQRANDYCSVVKKYKQHICDPIEFKGWVPRRSWWKRLFGVNK